MESGFGSGELQRRHRSQKQMFMNNRKSVAEAILKWAKLARALLFVKKKHERFATNETEHGFKAFTMPAKLAECHDPASLCIDLSHWPYEKAFADAEEEDLCRHILPETYWKLQKWLQIGKEKKLSEAKDTVDQFLVHCISLKRQKAKVVVCLTSYMKAVEENSDAPDHIYENGSLRFELLCS
ncbi:Cytochrome [Forsythia ovata]|uniref:Cytochrome n=1 Tax=Forsythia ovata TaxID=205694 RepID=A0ABD1S4R1_9LAMI